MSTWADPSPRVLRRWRRWGLDAERRLTTAERRALVTRHGRELALLATRGDPMPGWCRTLPLPARAYLASEALHDLAARGWFTDAEVIGAMLGQPAAELCASVRSA